MEPVSLTSKRTASYAALNGIVCDFAHALITSLGHPVVLAKPLSDADITKFSAFRESTAAGLATLAFRMVPLKGSVLVAIPVQLVQALVDLDYGGDGSFNAERKELLPSELRYFERFERIAAQALAGAWKEASHADASAIRLDLAMGIPAAFALDEEVAVHRFEIGIRYAAQPAADKRVRQIDGWDHRSGMARKLWRSRHAGSPAGPHYLCPARTSPHPAALIATG
jgi:Flagellar motor switch protein FliM